MEKHFVVKRFYVSCILYPLLMLGTSAEAAQVSGTMKGEDGNPIANAYVSVISHPEPAKVGDPPASTFHTTVNTAADGSYTVADIPAGRYKVCTQVPQSEWISSCLWTADPPRLTLTAAQSLAVPITLTKGYKLKVRLEDTNKYMTKEEMKPGATVQLGVFHPNGMYTSALMVGGDAEGRDAEMLVPFDTDVKVAVSSNYFSLADEKGKKLDKGGSEVARVEKNKPAKVHKFVVTGVVGK